MERYEYEGYPIVYSGFMLDGFYVFQYEADDIDGELIYISKTKLETLKKL